MHPNGRPGGREGASRQLPMRKRYRTPATAISSGTTPCVNEHRMNHLRWSLELCFVNASDILLWLYVQVSLCGIDPEGTPHLITKKRERTQCSTYCKYTMPECILGT